MDKDISVIEGQLATQNASDESNSQVLISMEGMIKSYIAQIDKNADEAKKLKEMLDDILKNDPTYAEHLNLSDEAAKIKNKTKAEILKRPQAADLNNKLKNLRSTIKESKDTLTDYLREYQRMSGVNEIEGQDGEVREIILVPKLVKKSSIFK